MMKLLIENGAAKRFASMVFKQFTATDLWNHCNSSFKNSMYFELEYILIYKTAQNDIKCLKPVLRTWLICSDFCRVGDLE